MMKTGRYFCMLETSICFGQEKANRLEDENVPIMKFTILAVNSIRFQFSTVKALQDLFVGG